MLVKHTTNILIISVWLFVEISTANFTVIHHKVDDGGKQPLQRVSLFTRPHDATFVQRTRPFSFLSCPMAKPHALWKAVLRQRGLGVEISHFKTTSSCSHIGNEVTETQSRRWAPRDLKPCSNENSSSQLLMMLIEATSWVFSLRVCVSVPRYNIFYPRSLKRRTTLVTADYN